MTPEWFDCEQNSPEWHAARCGIPTASEFATILASGRNGEASKTRRQYLYRLAGEIITGRPAETFSNAHMERGRAMEDEARDAYAFLQGVDPRRVGFVRNGRVGASPDSLVGDDGLVEIKTALPHILIPMLLDGEFPAQHRAQVQGQLMVTGRAWCDLVVYWPRLPLFVARATRDEDYIAVLQDGIDAFCADLDAIINRLRAFE